MASRGEPRGGSLARAFFCVGISVDASGAPAPKLLLRRSFAAGGTSNASDDQLVTVAFEKHFCFPEYVPGNLTSLMPETHARPSTYTFALTESDGSQTIGFCRRFLPPGDHARYPIVTCVLSKLPWFTFFWGALEPLDAHVWPLARPALFDTSGARPESTNPAMPPDAHVTRYLTELFERSAPPPRAEVAASTPWHPPGTAFPQRVSLYAPDDGATSSRVAAVAARGVRFAPLLRGKFTDVQCCVALFAALLFERRVIVVGADAASASRAAHAAAALIAPFEWQHIFLPSLPHAFLEVCTAPMPFLVGVHAAHAAALDRMPKEEVFRVNLDTGEYTYFPADLDALPSKPRRALEQKLEFQVRGSSRIDDAAVARAFRVFLSTVVSSYRKHVVPETSERPVPRNALVADGVWLDQNAFEATAATRRTKMMLGNLRGTRLYEVFVRGRLAAIARDPNQAGFLGARLGSSTAGEGVTGSLMGGGGGSSSGGDAASGPMHSAVSAEAALLAYAAEDFQHELPHDAALTAMYRAGSASAAAGAASAAAATTRAAAQAAKSAAWGARTSAKMFDAFVGSARAYGARTYGNTSLAGSTAGMHGNNAHKGNYGAFEGGHDDDSPAGGPARSAGAFVGVDRFRRDDEGKSAEEASAAKPPPAPSTATTAAAAAAAALARHQAPHRAATSPGGLSIDVHARAYHSATPSPTAPAASPASNFSPTAFSPTPSSAFSPTGSASGPDSGPAGVPRGQSSSGSMAAAIAAASARRALSPTGTAGTSSPQFSPTNGSAAAFSGSGSPRSSALEEPFAAADPFAAAVAAGNAPPVLQAAPTSRRTTSRTDWVDFDAQTSGYEKTLPGPGGDPRGSTPGGYPNPGTSPASPSAASAASPSSVASPGGGAPGAGALADPFATLTVTDAVRFAQQKRTSAAVSVPAQMPAEPGDALAAALGLDSPTSQPSLIDF